MDEILPKGKSNFSFSHCVFKRFVLKTRKNQGLFGKGLRKDLMMSPALDTKKKNIVAKKKIGLLPKGGINRVEMAIIIPWTQIRQAGDCITCFLSLPWFDALYWLADCSIWCLTSFSTIFQLYRGGQCTYPCFPGVLLTSTPHNILTKPLIALPQNHCQSNRQL